MKLDLNSLKSLVEEHYLRFQKHPSKPLSIYNYTEKAQYDRFWNEYTLICRGLVVDNNGQIVARPFKKFFNLNEHIGLNGDLPDEPFKVYDKLDGSLIILFKYQGVMEVASRGSFISEQAQKAKEIIASKYPQLSQNLDNDKTYLCEILYPENRIVVDYGNVSDLYLLAVVDNKTGEDLPIPEIGLPIVTQHHHQGGFRDLPVIPNTEGYVLHFHSGIRVKVKNEEYLRLHRLLTQTTPKDIWESLKANDSLDSLFQDVPDEFYEWINQWLNKLKSDYQVIEDQAKAAFKEIDITAPRKDSALKILDKPEFLRPILFSMLSGKDYAEIIWKQIKPETASQTFRVDEAELATSEDSTTEKPLSHKAPWKANSQKVATTEVKSSDSSSKEKELN